MKTLFLFLLLSLCNLFAKAAIMPVFPEHKAKAIALVNSVADTTAPKVYPDTVGINLPDSLFFFIYAFLPEKGRIDVGKLQNWMADSIPMAFDSTTMQPYPTKPGTRRTFYADNELLFYAYLALGNVPERIVAHWNAVVQAELEKQLYPRRLDILENMFLAKMLNEGELRKKVQLDGYDRIWKLKN